MIIVITITIIPSYRVTEYVHFEESAQSECTRPRCYVVQRQAAARQIANALDWTDNLLVNNFSIERAPWSDGLGRGHPSAGTKSKGGGGWDRQKSNRFLMSAIV